MLEICVVQVPARVLGEAQFYGTHKMLYVFGRRPVHVPARRDNLVLELVEVHSARQVPEYFVIYVPRRQHMSPPPISRILEPEMQRRFNDGRYWERLKSGELSAILLEDRHPAVTAANEPHCTRSQMVSYRDQESNEVARVHQYLRADGSLGASGKPDPKRLFEDGILYRLVKKVNRQQGQG